MKNLTFIRKCSQIIFLTLFIYILWSTTYPLKGMFPPETFFKANPLIMIAMSLSERLILPGLAIALTMLLLGLALGRFFCGWICPLGTLMDLSGSLKKKRAVLDDNMNLKIRRVKFFALGSIGLFALLGIQTAWILDPMVITARFVSLNLIPTATLLTDKLFIFLIRDMGMTAVHDVYRALKSSLLGVNIHYFANSMMIFSFFIVIVLSSLVLPRLWCRSLCPLGALYSLVSRFALLERIVVKCVNCGRCGEVPTMGAITKDADYIKTECILCMECVYGCPPGGTRFAWTLSASKTSHKHAALTEKGLSRGEFLVFMLLPLFLAGFKRSSIRGNKDASDTGVIRPPGSLEEKEFLSRCIRCGNCMKVCVTNGLHPIMLQAGLEGIWTPQLIPEIGYCEYNCTLCGNVCPTGAIPRLPLEEKKKTRLGTARVDRSICLAWEHKKECIVCEEHCPVPTKAIKLIRDTSDGKTIWKPVVETSLCIGCGICQNKCPVLPTRAIRVYPDR